ncbi:hypothetical protein [Streptomyces sp. NPDC058572]|uniref:hypothetical protein n=1 Tax=Streptomyces sp. NPDC058572 TaxID=3346546 RepID=UPI003658FD37
MCEQSVEKWQEDAGTGVTHERHEVTVQLSGPGLRPNSRQPAPGAAQDGSDGPVFVDESGRRSRKFRRIGWLLVAACACYAITLVAALMSGNSAAPFLPGLGRAEDKQAEQVEIQPAPTDRASGVATPGSTPGAPTPSDSSGAALPQPSGSASGSSSLPAVPVPGASGSAPAKPSGGPKPPRPAASSPAPGSSDPGPASSAPDPSPSDAPSGDPTDPPVQEGAP